jgi:hypothetical protein
MKHYELEPIMPHTKPLIFDWDEATGTVSGRDSARIIEISTWGEVDAHPYGFVHQLSKKTLRNKTDIAAILGREYRLPDDLLPFYPQFEDDGFPEETYVDEDGTLVIGRDMIQY